MSEEPIAVSSEIGKLRKVLLHRPGREIETLTPEILESMLFEDIPWLERIREEHDHFAGTLRKQGCEVFYYQDLLIQTLSDADARRDMVEDILKRCRVSNEKTRGEIQDFLMDRDSGELTDILIGGLRKDDVPQKEKKNSLSHYIRDGFSFSLDPLPNLYFTRDPGAVIGKGLAVSVMKTAARFRESVLLDFLRRRHPLFASLHIWYDPSQKDSIEGGDILVLSDRVAAVGASARTSNEAIEKLAFNLLSGDSGYRELLVLQIPKTRASMHLDTVLTMLDRDSFTVFPGMIDKLQVFRLNLGPNRGIKIRKEHSLKSALKRALKLPALRLIPSGGDNQHTALREQWNEGANTLALEAGTVITYKRNEISNAILREHGIKVVEIEGSELLRGRGGPRCMSMPLLRDPVP